MRKVDRLLLKHLKFRVFNYSRKLSARLHKPKDRNSARSQSGRRDGRSRGAQDDSRRLEASARGDIYIWLCREQSSSWARAIGTGRSSRNRCSREFALLQAAEGSRRPCGDQSATPTWPLPFDIDDDDDCECRREERDERAAHDDAREPKYRQMRRRRSSRLWRDARDTTSVSIDDERRRSTPLACPPIALECFSTLVYTNRALDCPKSRKNTQKKTRSAQSPTHKKTRFISAIKLLVSRRLLRCKSANVTPTSRRQSALVIECSRATIRLHTAKMRTSIVID